MSSSYQESIKDLFLKHKFIHPESAVLENDFIQLLSVIDKQEFFLQCNLNPAVTYNEAVFKACRKASMYILYAISQKLHMGRYKLKEIQVCDGLVGNTPHTWLLFGNKYYVDMTLAQFTPLAIPEIAILPIELGTDIYQVNHIFTWQEYAKLEAEA